MSNHQKIALVTGATRGSASKPCASSPAGVHMLLAGRDRAKAVDAALSCRPKGCRSKPSRSTSADDGSIAAAPRRSQASTAGSTSWSTTPASSATIVQPSRLRSSRWTTWRETFDTNVFGVVATTQAFLPLLKPAPAARIVNVSSLLGFARANSDPASPIYDFKSAGLQRVQERGERMDRASGARIAGHPDQGQRRASGFGEDRHERRGRDRSGRRRQDQRRMALLDDDGPTGGFVYLEETLPW